MNCEIYLNGDNITSEIESYTRQQSLCSSIGTLTMSVKGESTRDFTPGGTIVIYENGIKQGTYYINIQEEQFTGNHTWMVSGQDGSKLLQDYFITESYTIDGTLTTSRYWITKFLVEAGINYYFTTSDDGVYLADLTTLGMASLYDTLTPLLQNNGWFLYFNAENYAIIGEVETGTPADSVDDNEILEINDAVDDQMLRNQAIVWGNYNPFTQINTLSNITDLTGYEMSAQDARPIVISNQFITVQAEADFIANKLLEQFSTLTDVKTIRVADALNLRVAQTVAVSSIGWTGSGLLTNMSVSMSKNGLITELTLDQRCPRLISFRAKGGRVFFNKPVNRNAISWSPDSGDWPLTEKYRAITSPDSFNTVKGIKDSGVQHTAFPVTSHGCLFYENYIFPISTTINNIYRMKLNGTELINCEIPFITQHSFAVLSENIVLDFWSSGDIIYMIDYNNTFMDGPEVHATRSTYLDLGDILGDYITNYKAYLDKNLVIHIFYTKSETLSSQKSLWYNYYITTSGSWGTPQDITPTPEINNTFGYIPTGGAYNKLYTTELDNGLRGLLDIIETGPAPFFLSIPQHLFFDIVGFSASCTKYVPGSTDDILGTDRLSLITDYTNNTAYFLTSESPAPIQFRISEIKAGGMLETIFDSDADGRILISSSKNIAVYLDESGQFYQLPGLTPLGDIGGTPFSVTYNLDDDDDGLLQGTGNNTNRYKYNIYTGALTQYASGLSVGSGERTILLGQIVVTPGEFYYPTTFATTPTTFTYFAGRIIY